MIIAIFFAMCFDIKDFIGNNIGRETRILRIIFTLKFKIKHWFHCFPFAILMYLFALIEKSECVTKRRRILPQSNLHKWITCFVWSKPNGIPNGRTFCHKCKIFKNIIHYWWNLIMKITCKCNHCVLKYSLHAHNSYYSLYYLLLLKQFMKKCCTLISVSFFFKSHTNKYNQLMSCRCNEHIVDLTNLDILLRIYQQNKISFHSSLTYVQNRFNINWNKSDLTMNEHIQQIIE